MNTVASKKLGEINVLDHFPCKTPYKFVDEVISIDMDSIVTSYTFKENEFFYKGHFPNNPTTPGAILLEAAAQTLLCHGIYIIYKEFGIHNNNFLLVESNIKFKKILRPNVKIIINSEKIFFRHNKLRSKVQIELPNGELVGRGIISGIYKVENHE